VGNERDGILSEKKEAPVDAEAMAIIEPASGSEPPARTGFVLNIAAEEHDSARLSEGARRVVIRRPGRHERRNVTILDEPAQVFGVAPDALAAA
jgi:hypothetical protein